MIFTSIYQSIPPPASLIPAVVALGLAFVVLASRVAERKMIWYFLYPFRGTTAPPVLDTKHPLRNAFTRFGANAARHPVYTLLVSVAVAVALIYPFPFLYTNDFANGASNLPRHVWTSATPLETNTDMRADVVMRSIWVHGSYMKALEPKVLLSALEIQDEILGPTLDFDPRRPQGEVYPNNIASTEYSPAIRDGFHAINGLSNSSWFFHSPLQYWSCSAGNILRDEEIIKTVNEGSRQATSVNVTLRHSIVFSGKRFEDHRLVAADALIITLIHKLDSPVGRQWEQRAEEIATKSSNKWRLIPSDGRALLSTLYEFRFQPLSFQDDLFLALAYSLTTLYFALSLSKLRALKSRLGLIIAVSTQIFVSIMSSFTVCAVLKIDLSKIPREAYPLVILTIGLENIFRYINAVIMTPPESSTSARMGEALGQTGHVAFAAVGQNLAILWLLSKVVSSQIAAFCSFAAIAITFDFFYLMTFFTAVLSIDVRRTELGDSLKKAPTRSMRHLSPNQPRKTWTDSVLRGDAPVSTRIAGTVVMISFILIAQWHFFENESLPQTALRFLRFITSRPHESRVTSPALLSVGINQARTQTAWLRMQDHETAHEIIKVIKPHAKSYIARVYDPLIFVLDGSDRTSTQLGVRPFLPAAYDFVRHQSGVFLTTLVFIVGAVSLLMNYLLWNEFPEGEEDERRDDAPLLSIKTLPRGHALDVVLLTACKEGVIASVGLDRWIRIWDTRKGNFSYTVRDPSSDINPFPVLAMAIDSDSNWLALLSAQNKALLWNIPERRWGPVMDVDVKGRKPAAFFFGYHQSELINPVVVVRPNGMMTELHMESNESNTLQVCRSPLVCVRPHFEKPTPQCAHPPPRIVTSSKRGCIHVGSLLDQGWISEDIEIPDPEDDKQVLSILPLPALSSFLTVRSHTIELIDIFTHKVTHTFATQPMKHESLRCFHSTRRRPQCGSVGLAYLALAYTSADTGSLILQSYLPEREGDTICFRDPWTPGSKTCCLWRETVENNYVVENPGEWEALPVGYIVGVRRREKEHHKESVGHHTQPLAGLRRRGVNLKQSSSTDARQPEKEEDDSWEVWSLNSRGDRSTIPLCDEQEGRDYLLISRLGPIVQVGKRSLAVALGNVIKFITVGSDRFDDQETVNNDTSFVGMAASSRKRKPALRPERRQAVGGTGGSI
ncbi:Sterol regulatory element-binding protein cleavage-activating protein [Lachnellula occidentalis]|uniref:Sterol regulatory element-binding protein cleavage-activating protein n=1 Tax=Lachnellula occidentalis TaxID=215460 RepID=A0A8H8RL27_9HELO|nr:Sterol regulatory element-binding protein cleavage-activating protein [Lachnellula occidentalis]